MATETTKMELPTYFSYKEFLSNIRDDYNRFTDKYPNCTFAYFLEEVFSMYNIYTDLVLYDLSVQIIKIEKLQIRNHVHYSIEDEIMISELVKYLNYEIDKILEKDEDKSRSSIFQGLISSAESFEILTINENIERGYIILKDTEIKINIDEFKIFENFIYVDEDTDELIYDEDAWRDFQYSFPQIMDFFKKEQKELFDDDTTERNEEEEEIRPNKNLSIPQKIKIFDELNFRGMMQEKGFTDFQTIQFLADVFDRSEKTVRNNLQSKVHSMTANSYIQNLKQVKAKR